ncbi:MAG: dUTP diphosphatase [Spirochaetia bacterium]|nr:dUTP diphosphatase [Spirochaetia bacterium]
MVIKMRTASGSKLPHYQTPYSAGADLYANLDKPVTIEPGKRSLISTGLFLEIPANFEGQIRPRSGLAYKHGITVLNSPGTIDADYRGEIKILLINLGELPYTVNHNDRIAQLIIAPVTKAVFTQKNTINDTDRGTGGFGSTGL